ncbi:hypothetical protein NQ317_006525 [Molorchus minor]|uniref:Uncharacterized protein n=1 Tax=Molorchus minor TaxID=1323400 RepID=A0ABQ9IWH9_9CUCU|nr:hypothetical protein NQ317_006525 [Molorchus minor]
MDVDREQLKSDDEEGEIVWPNMKGIFTTGINIFDKQEQEKLQERAKRFPLKPDEIHNFTDADLEQLHESLGHHRKTQTMLDSRLLTH